MFAALLVLAWSIALWPRPAAAAAGGVVELKLDYWPATTTETTSGSFSPPMTWTTQYWGGDLRWTSTQHWGIHLKYDTGSEGSFGGFPGPPNLGAPGAATDTVWSGDVFYAWQLPAVTVRGFAGYGSVRYSASSVPSFFGLIDYTIDTEGYRVGADVTVPIRDSGFAFNASAAWYPSMTTNSTTTFHSFAGTFRNSAATTGSDLSASVQYTWTRGWLVEGGYRWITLNTGRFANGAAPTTFTTNGPFFSVGYRW